MIAVESVQEYIKEKREEISRDLKKDHIPEEEKWYYSGFQRAMDIIAHKIQHKVGSVQDYIPEKIKEISKDLKKEYTSEPDMWYDKGFLRAMKNMAQQLSLEIISDNPTKRTVSFDSIDPTKFCLECASKHALASHAILEEVVDRLRQTGQVIEGDKQIAHKLLKAQGQLVEVDSHSKDPKVTNPREVGILSDLGKQARETRILLRNALNNNQVGKISQAINKNWQLVLAIQNAIFELGECENCKLGVEEIKAKITSSPNANSEKWRQTLIRTNPRTNPGVKHMMSLTSFTDRWVDPSTSIAYGTEVIAAGAELPIDLFLKGIGAKLAKIGLGALTGLTAHFGQKYLGFLRANPRLRSELHEVAAHFLVEGLDPTPGEIRVMAAQLREIREGARFGVPLKDQLKKLTYSQREITESLNQFAGAIGLATGRPLIRTEVTPAERAPTPALVERGPGPGIAPIEEIRPTFGLIIESTGR